MNPRIETLEEKKLMGQRIQMSLLHNKTNELWQHFMPRRKEIQNNIGTDLYAIQLYDPSYFNNFDPATTFEKWAAIEVTHFNSIPCEMETITLGAGLYAVFHHRGQSTAIFETIFSTWIPNSIYVLDHRPHFELLGAKYKNNHSDSEEEIWIPIKIK